MDKQQLLEEVRQMAQSGQISQSEVLAVFSAVPGQTSEGPSKGLTISEILYYIGGAIVF